MTTFILDTLMLAVVSGCLGSAAAPGALFHLSHFATCPDAGKWRRK